MNFIELYRRCVELIDVIRLSDPAVADYFQRRLFEIAEDAYRAVDQDTTRQDWVAILQDFRIMLEKRLAKWSADAVFDPACGSGRTINVAVARPRR